MKLARALLACLVVASLPLVLHAEDDEDDGQATKETRAAMEKKKEALFAKKLYDETGHVRLHAPKPGEWLFRFQESGQDAADYKQDCKNRKSKERSKIYVTEMGELSKRSQDVQPAVREFVHAFFQLEVVRREPEKAPKGSWNKKREQHDGDEILRALEKTLPDDALVSVGLLDQDLYTQGLNFIFGEGSLEKRVGVYSFHRFGGDAVDESLYRKRCFRLVGHEMGHILGMEHCVYYECVMNGANSLDEDDTAPLHLCPVCLDKLTWNVGTGERGAEPGASTWALAREKDLEKVLSKNEIKDEAAWSKARIERLEKK